MNWQFQYPQAFWLLVLIPLYILLFLVYRFWRIKALKKAGDIKLVRSMIPSYSSAKSILKFILIIISFALGCVALSNPRKPDQSSAEARKGIDIVMALDVSNSMMATDISPNRLGRAKNFIFQLMDNLPDDRIGLVVFAGNAYEQMPLTFDREAARMYISGANPSLAGSQGTSIGDALLKSSQMFTDQTGRFRSVILITDGETHDENALQEAKELAKNGVMINTIGIGSAVGSTLKDSTGQTKKDANGEVVISKLNESLLQQLASLTNGKYILLDQSNEAIKEILEQYSQIDKKALGDTSLMNFQSYYYWLTLPMLILLIVELFLPDRKKAKLA